MTDCLGTVPTATHLPDKLNLLPTQPRNRTMLIFMLKDVLGGGYKGSP